MVRRAAQIGLVLLASAGCSEPPAETAEPRLLATDTLRIIEHEQFWDIRTVRFLGERVLVLNGGPREALFFGADGQLERSLGRQGDGPGEFGVVRDVVARGDSTWILDSLLRRLSLFLGAEVIREWSLIDLPGTHVRLAVIEDGTPILAVDRTPEPAAPPGPVFQRRSIEFVELVADGGAQWRSLFAIAGTEMMTQFLGEATRQSLPSFRANTSYEMAGNGVVAVDHRTGRIGAWNWEGDSITIRSPSSEPVYVSESELQRREEAVETQARALAASGSDPEPYLAGARASVERWQGRIPRPVFEDLKSDGRTIAVMEYEFGSEHAAVWLFLDRSGEILGRLVLPSNQRLMTLDGQRLAVLVRDSLDVESIMILRINKGAH